MPTFYKNAKERIVPYLIGLNFILLMFKSKFLFVLIISTIQISYLFIFNPMVLINWDIYGISLSSVSVEDIRLLYNIFGTNILLFNIFFLIFINQNCFIFDFNKKKLLELLEKDYLYWIILCLLLILTIYFSLGWPAGEIVNIYFLCSPCGLPYKHLLLDPYYFRFSLILILRLLAIYVAFASHDRSLFYRLALWFFLILLLRLASLNSSFIVDVLVCFIVINPDIDNLRNFNWKIYFESVFSFLMEDKTETDKDKIARLEKSLEKRRNGVEPDITSWSSRWMHSTESLKDKNERYDHCLDKVGSGYTCASHTQTLISQAMESVFPHTLGVVADTEKKLDISTQLIDKNEQLIQCVNNTDWKHAKAVDDQNEKQQEETLKKQAVEEAEKLINDEWRRHG